MSFYQEHQALMEELIRNQYMGAIQTPQELQAAARIDAPILSTTSGFVNDTFGPAAFAQFNNSSVLLKILAKFQYKRAGFRARTTRYISSSIGVAQNGAIPDTVKYTPVEVTVGIKEQALAYEFSERIRLLAGSLDDIAFDMSSADQDAMDDFSYAVDADLNDNVTNLPVSDMEALDRMVSSYAEVTNCSDLTASDADFYGQDRDAGATVFDAYVNHNSGTIRPISNKIIGTLVQQSVAAGANPASQGWYMGTDTWEQITEIENPKIRYRDMDAAFAAATATDGNPAKGAGFGIEMGTLRGRPVYVADESKVAQSGAGGTGSAISNLYLLDLGINPKVNEPWIGIKVLRAPIRARTGLADGYPAHGKLGNEELIYSAMELQCSRPGIMAKARDLGEAV